MEAELRCGRCRDAFPGRRPTLLATIRGHEVLIPVRIGARKAREGGVGRAGMFWRTPVEAAGLMLLRCRRCGAAPELRRAALVGAASDTRGRTLYVSASTLTMA